MGRTARPRKAYRPRVLVDPMQRATTGVAKLSVQDVAGQMHIARTALAEFTCARDCAHHWRSLADTANMAEALARERIGTGADAERTIHAAQKTLHDVAQRHTAGRGWTLYAAEIDTLQWLLSLHHLQLAECSYAEFDRAFTGTRNRIAQARAGNAPAGAVIVEGEIA